MCNVELLWFFGDVSQVSIILVSIIVIVFIDWNSVVGILILNV